MEVSYILRKIAKKIVAKVPRKIEPELATLAEEIPVGEDWIFENKYDGYRILLRKDGEAIQLLTRNDKDWTERYPSIEEDAVGLKADSVILDGEIIVEHEGKSDFQALQNVLKTKDYNMLRYYVFDLLYLDGEDLRKFPLVERKERLKTLLAVSPTKQILYSTHFTGNGGKFLEQVCAKGEEGIIAKNIYSTYIGKRTKDWLKVKCSHRQEFVIGGYTPVESEEKEGIGALFLGVYEKNVLIYVGKVGTGFSDEERIKIEKDLRPLTQNESPFRDEIKGVKNAIWVNPIKVCEVAFFDWTSEGLLRHPVYKGMREDKWPKQVRRED